MRLQPGCRSLVRLVNALAVVWSLLIGCKRAARTVETQADSVRMVNSILEILREEDSAMRTMCRGPDGLLHRNTSGSSCIAPSPAPIGRRVLAILRDSAGACVWIETIRPLGTVVLDGGPRGWPIARDGSIREAALLSNYCSSLWTIHLTKH
jgi:hypothetical protein